MKPNDGDELILFGNGIGRAIDPYKFLLKSAAKDSMDKLSEEEKNIIMSIVNENFSNFDNIESDPELAYLNLISILSYRFFDGPDSKRKHELHTENLKILARAINKFIYATAEFFNNVKVDKNESLLDKFFNNLNNHLEAAKENEKKVHVATTNYDDLFYRYFLDDKFMTPNQDTFFTDGFNRDGKVQNLRFNPEKSPECSWYMHLHGSSRFYSNYNSNIVHKLNKDPKKRKEWLYPDNDQKMRIFVPHIILNYFRAKHFQIITNGFISKYFEKFRDILPSINKLYLIGYGGFDQHINETIKESLPKNTQIMIVEYSNSKDCQQRKKFWVEKLKRNEIDLKLLDNILKYDLSPKIL